jgi:predicted nucleic acid-binding protein
VSVYLDASVLVALFTADAMSDRADRILRASKPVVIVSDFAAAEFASAIAYRVRTRLLKAAEAQAVFSHFDVMVARAARRIEMTAGDVAAAAAFLRRLDLTLRTPDAINIALAQRAGAQLLTFDRQMAKAARALDMELAE